MARFSYQDNNSGMKQRILLVEDNDQVRKALALSLEMDGFDVREAAHGLEALALLKKFQPHLILADIKMPTMPNSSGDMACAMTKLFTTPSATPK